MAITHSLTLTYKTGSGSVSMPLESIPGDQEKNTEVAVDANATNKQVTLAIDVSELKGCCIKSDKNVTIKTNSTSDPDATIALIANKGIVWRKGVDPDAANPFGDTDVTTIYITNGNSAVANVGVYAIVDATP